MNVKIYRGTKLGEALRIQEGDTPKKYLYRIDNNSEAKFYAYANKMKDKNFRGSIVEAKLSVADTDLQYLTEDQYLSLEQPQGKKILRNKIGVYKVGDFRLFLVPPKFHSAITKPKIVEVV